MQVQQVTERLSLGEGPHWDEKTQSLYFVDIVGHSIHKYVPSTGKHTKAIIEGGAVSLIIPVEKTENEFLISVNRKLMIVTWDGVSQKVSSMKTIEKIGDVSGNRFNDGKVDSAGRLWLGTMGAESSDGTFEMGKGSFYTLLKGQALKKHFENVGISNGLAWHDAKKKFYYIDSLLKRVDEFDYDAASATISNRKSIFDFEATGVPGLPDGMAIDTDGNLWVAVFGGSRVIKINPNVPNSLLATVEIPGKQVTSVAFGGTNLDELFVTTANVVVNNIQLDSPNGATFKITNTGAKGFPGIKIKV